MFLPFLRVGGWRKSRDFPWSHERKKTSQLLCFRMDGCQLLLGVKEPISHWITQSETQCGYLWVYITCTCLQPETEPVGHKISVTSGANMWNNWFYKLHSWRLWLWITVLQNGGHLFTLPLWTVNLNTMGLPGSADPLWRFCASRGQQPSACCWKPLSRCRRFCSRLYSCFMLCRICSETKKCIRTVILSDTEDTRDKDKAQFTDYITDAAGNITTCDV